MAQSIIRRAVITASTGPPPNPYAAVLELLGEDGFFWIHTEGVDTGGGGIGSPVESWTDVTGSATLPRIGPGSKRPTLTASGLLFDGVDDCLTYETLGPEFDSYLAANGATGGTFGAHLAVAANDDNFERLINYFNSANSFQTWVDSTQVLKQSAYPDNFSPVTPASGTNLSVSGGIGGAGTAIRRVIDDSVTESTTIGFGSGYANMTRIGLGTNLNSTGNFWDGTLGALWMAPRVLSAVQLQDLHAAIDALLT